MLSKRSTIHLLVLALFTLSACITPPTPTETPPEPTKTPKPPSPESKIIKYCQPNGTEALNSPDGEYCFARPYGYYSYKKDEEPNSFFVQSGNPTMNTSPEAPNPTTLPLPVVLKIRHEPEKNGDETLTGYIGRDAQVDLDDLSPWTLSGSQAFIGKKHQGSTVIYYIYTKHGAKF